LDLLLGSGTDYEGDEKWYAMVARELRPPMEELLRPAATHEVVEVTEEDQYLMSRAA
jgi:hypothetical protein